MKWLRVTFTTNEPDSFICLIWALCSCTQQNLWKSYYRNTGSSLWWAAFLLSSSVSGTKDVHLSEGVIRLLWFQLHDITNYWQTGRNSTQNKNRILHEYKAEEILFGYGDVLFLIKLGCKINYSEHESLTKLFTMQNGIILFSLKHDTNRWFKKQS